MLSISGAELDIKIATKIIKSMILTYGMSSKFGMTNLNVLVISDNNLDSEVIKTAVGWSNELYNETLSFLQSNIDVLKEVADKLIEQETLTGQELESVINKHYLKKVL